MVRRRCRVIITSDAGEDGKMTFEDLGNAVRRVEIDFGVKIRFEKFDIDGKVNDTSATFAIGEITYPEDPAKKGLLLYIKPCLDDRAPLSVRSYAKLNDKFPHDSTTNQFFGETQFEAYRALGEHIVDTIAKDATYSDAASFITAIKSKAAGVQLKKSAKAGE